jgi:hypothetical protein
MRRNSAHLVVSLFAWNDLLWTFFCCALTVVAILITMTVAKKTPQDQVAVDDGIYFRIRWRDNSDIDVDLWSRAPGDIPVGYSAKQGRFFALKEDNLGKGAYLGGDRREESHAFATPPGEYCATAGLYRTAELVDGAHPLRVDYVAVLHFGGYETVVADGFVNLTRVGEEKTLACFTLDDRKMIVPGSLNTIERRIWRAP